MAENSAMAELHYQTPMSFDEYWKFQHPEYGYGRETGLHLDNPNSLANKFANIFTGKVTSAKQQYENYLAGVEANNNAYYAQEANKQTYAREDTETQRKKADYEAAGLNPYLLVNSGGVIGGASSQAQSGSYKRSSKSTEKEESKMASSALKILAIIALRGLMKG